MFGSTDARAGCLCWSANDYGRGRCRARPVVGQEVCGAHARMLYVRFLEDASVAGLAELFRLTPAQVVVAIRRTAARRLGA